MFNTVPVSIAFVPEIETELLTCIVRRGTAIDEKHGVFDIVFLAEFSEEQTAMVLFLVDSSCVYSKSFDSESTAAYSQYYSSLSRITVSSTAT
jgi:hypothetical protein